MANPERLTFLRRSRAGFLTHVTRRHRELQDAIQRGSAEEAEDRLHRLRAAFCNFDESHLQYLDLAFTMDPQDAYNSDEQHRYYAKLVHDAEHEVSAMYPSPNVTPQDSVSQSGTRSTSRSGRTSSSTTTSSRAKAAAKKAALMAKAEGLRRQQDLELQLKREHLELELRMQQSCHELERLKLEAEISAAAAEEDTLSKFAHSGSVKTSSSRGQRHIDRTSTVLKPVASGLAPSQSATLGRTPSGPGPSGLTPSGTVPLGSEPPGSGRRGPVPQGPVLGQTDTKKTLDPKASEFVPSQHKPAEPQLSVALLAEQLSLHRLPPPEPEIFSGDPLKYGRWKTAFESLIESKAIKASERIYYLSRYLAGEAKSAVEGYLLLNSDEAYLEAKALLESRYGDQFRVSCAFRRKLDSWPRISGNDGIALRNFSDFLLQCSAAMDSMKTLDVLNDMQENQRILKKLPDWLVTRWARHAQSWKEENHTFPPFKTFAQFIQKEAELACDPVTSLQAIKKDNPQPKQKNDKEKKKEPFGRKSSFVTDSKPIVQTEKRQSTPSCYFCQEQHYVDNCKQFMQIARTEREDFAKKKGLCFGCLRRGHRTKDCRIRAHCRTCQKRHPTAFHSDGRVSKDKEVNPDNKIEKPDKDKEVKPEAVSMASRAKCFSTTQKSSLILPVWIHHKDNPEREVLTYALLDTQSDTTFVINSLPQKLGLSGCATHLMISTMTAENKIIDSSKFRGLVVRGYNSDVTIPLPATFTRESIPGNRNHIPTPEMASRWTHLSCIAPKLMPLCDAEIGLLIGYNCSRALAPREVIADSHDIPFAQRTDLGWGIVGNVEPDPKEEQLDDIGHSHRILTCETAVPPAHVQFIHKTSVKECFQTSDVLKALEMDFSDRQLDTGGVISFEDRQFLNILTNGIHQRDDLHYEMPLPLKETLPRLPNNRQLAVQRLQQLKRKLQREKRFRSDYTKFMEEMLQKGYAESVPEDDQTKDGSIWYIPHHGVYHPKKPEKIRVVFDASAKYQGHSLNDHLLKGPDMINTLIGILCRFRQEPVAVICDIEKMFYQFAVNKEDRDLLRFLWWEGGNLDEHPKEYRMTVHIFGAASSPGCANFGLKQCANDYEDKYGIQAASFVRDNFYVDDGLKSLPDVETAVELIHNVKAMCKDAGIRLHKFTSNSVEVVESIPVEDRASKLQDLDLLEDILPIERALGILWCIQSDKFQFKITLQEKPLTRRGILSTISTIYDPLGFIAPVILVGKQILQEMCRENADWDDPLPDQLRTRWERWISDLVHLEDICIKRCYKPDNFQDIRTMELHHFADASEDGYGQCTYLRQIDKQGRVHCSFIKGKARVAPLKVTTTPRLELTAALEAVRTSKFLQEELELDVSEYFWTDSTVVLGYIKNDAKKFRVFVANRVQQIRSHTDPLQWHHVKGENNPADDGSRGLYASDLANKSTWLTGPSFLWKEDFVLPGEPEAKLSPDDPEVKTRALAVQTSEETYSMSLDQISSWNTAKRAIATCHRFTRICKQKAENRKRGLLVSSHDTYTPLTVQDLQDAEMKILRLVQLEAFPELMEVLQSDKGTKTMPRKDTHLYKLDPYLDEEGVVRINGRLQAGQQTLALCHPVLLPKKHHITTLIIRHCHEKVEHQGRGMTINQIRSHGFWIVGGSSAVSSYISRCVKCRKLRGLFTEQKMADLPEDRLSEEPPFTFCGVDCFGPFLIKQGRKEEKRYGVLFTCLASRAVHIEVATSLSTDAFINALRRLICLRGPIRLLRSDRGTNFVGAKTELKEALKEMDQQQIERFLHSEGCDMEFKMNVPTASHMGGVWERQIRTARSILDSMLQKNGTQLNDETLRTLMYEVTAIINSRPLTSESLNDPSVRPISPNNLLTAKTKVILPPPGVFPCEDLYARKYWRRVQHLADQFWNRWRKEYLQSLQARQKWNIVRRNMKIGDIVLIKDDNLPRCHWRMGRVTETFPEADGRVRKVKLTLGKDHYLERPIQKLVILLECEDEDNYPTS